MLKQELTEKVEAAKELWEQGLVITDAYLLLVKLAARCEKLHAAIHHNHGKPAYRRTKTKFDDLYEDIRLVQRIDWYNEKVWARGTCKNLTTLPEGF
jgi:hypothetical protein